MLLWSLASDLGSAPYRNLMTLAYVLSRYPLLSETFILREMWELERQGHTVRIYALRAVRGDKRHPRAARLRAELERHFEAHDLTLELQLEMDSIEGICEVVARSEWTTILPSLAVRRGIAAGRLASRPIKPKMTRQLAIIHHPRHPLTPAADAVITQIREHIGRAVARSNHHE